jgi:hypothetical protein
MAQLVSEGDDLDAQLTGQRLPGRVQAAIFAPDRLDDHRLRGFAHMIHYVTDGAGGTSARRPWSIVERYLRDFPSCARGTSPRTSSRAPLAHIPRSWPLRIPALNRPGWCLDGRGFLIRMAEGSWLACTPPPSSYAWNPQVRPLDGSVRQIWRVGVCGVVIASTLSAITGELGWISWNLASPADDLPPSG